MTRPVRISLWMLCLLGFVAAGYVSRTASATLLQQAARTNVERGNAHALRSRVAELRNLLQTRIGLGNDTNWKTIDAALEKVQADVAARRDAESNALAKEELQGAAVELDSLALIASQAKDFLRNNQRTLANEVVFSDAAEVNVALLARLDRAEEQSAASSAAEEAGLLQRAAFAMAAMVLFGLVGLVASVSRAWKAGARTTADGDELSTESPAPEASAADLEPRAEAESFAAELSAAVTAVAPAAAPLVSSASTEDWAEVARVCTELARISDPQELASVLDRAIGLLGAKGVIVWLWNPQVGKLRAVLARGYEPRTLSRLPAIAKDEPNPAARAFRTGELQVVPANDLGLGVIVTPLLSPTGCLGVATAEMKDGRETLPPVHAMTRILAAQLQADGGDCQVVRDLSHRAEADAG